VIVPVLKLLLDVVASLLLATGIVKGIPPLAAVGGTLLVVGIVWMLRSSREGPTAR
jgi:hypothetical protein